MIGSMTAIAGFGVYVGSSTNDKLLLTTQGNPWANIQIGGNFNIGVLANDLGAKLGIKGSGSTSATKSLLVENSSGVASLQVNDKGSVFNFGKASISSNTVFGLDALQANTTGSQNTAMGLP
jgi:hypothetical protein